MNADPALIAPLFPAPNPMHPVPPLVVPEPDAQPPLSPPPTNWTAKLLSSGSRSLRGEAARFGTGLGLAAMYGLAAGARHGGTALFKSAVSVPLALVAATALGMPATYIVLALFDAPIDPHKLAAATSRAVATTGIVLAGLAPAAALFVVSSEHPAAAALTAALGLAVGSVTGYRTLVTDVLRGLDRSSEGLRLVSAAAVVAFGIFAAALSIRIWGSTLPLFGGGR